MQDPILVHNSRIEGYKIMNCTNTFDRKKAQRLKKEKLKCVFIRKKVR